MKTALLACAMLGLVGCGPRTALPDPDGAQFAPGMYSFPTQRAAVLEERTLDAWEPNHFYPALTAVSPTVSGTRPSILPARIPRHTTSRGPATASAWLWYSLYKETLSKVDGNTCRFHPSCSTFGLEAVREHGPLGVAMTFGRLHKNHGYERHYPMPRPPFLEDPVSNYGFWLRTPRLDDFASYDNEAHAWYQHLRATRRLKVE